MKKNGPGAKATVAVQLNTLPGEKLYGDDLGLIEDLATAVVSKVVEKQITTALKKAAAEP